MDSLDVILERLGLSDYLQSLRDEGFDTWETLMDITESDLDALGVKLGHRRKLQRAILESRGHTKDRQPLDSAGYTRNANEMDDVTHSAHDTKKTPDFGGPDPEVLPRQKRKYRRHPKPDGKAPERPPSAYVIFSNHMREKLRGQDLTFTEIARIVGERWQELTPAEKEPCERHAQALKDEYYSKLTEYKKTPDYALYQDYLGEFRAKHSQPAASEMVLSKRPKTEAAAGASLRSSSLDKTDDHTRRPEQFRADEDGPLSPASPSTTHSSATKATASTSVPHAASVLQWRSGVKEPNSPTDSSIAHSPISTSHRIHLPTMQKLSDGSWAAENSAWRSMMLPVHSTNNTSMTPYLPPDYQFRPLLQHTSSVENSRNPSQKSESTPALTRDDTPKTNYSDRPSEEWSHSPYALPALDTAKRHADRTLPPLVSAVPYASSGTGNTAQPHDLPRARQYSNPDADPQAHHPPREQPDSGLKFHERVPSSPQESAEVTESRPFYSSHQKDATSGSSPRLRR